MRQGIVALVLTLTTAVSAQTYRVSAHWKVGGQGGWDYLVSDDSAHRLYIAHNARVEVVDTQTGKPIGAVTGFKSTHGVALNPDGKLGYITDGAGNAVAVFDRATLTVKETIPVGINPDGIAFEPTSKTVWAFNGRSKSASVIDAATNKVIATISLPGKPEFPQVDGHGNVFVNIEDQNAIVRLDASRHQISATWPLVGCESPSGMAIDREQRRLFSVCDGKRMAVLSYGTGKLLGLAAIGSSPDAAAYDPKSHLAFSSNGEGTVTVIDVGKAGFPAVASIKTARGGRTMAYEATTGRIFVAAAQYGPPPSPTPSNPRPRPAPIPDSFEVVVISR